MDRRMSHVRLRISAVTDLALPSVRWPSAVDLMMKSMMESADAVAAGSLMGDAGSAIVFFPAADRVAAGEGLLPLPLLLLAAAGGDLLLGFAVFGSMLTDPVDDVDGRTGRMMKELRSPVDAMSSTDDAVRNLRLVDEDHKRSVSPVDASGGRCCQSIKSNCCQWLSPADDDEKQCSRRERRGCDCSRRLLEEKWLG